MLNQYIQKQVQQIPDYYTISIDFVDGKTEEIKIVEHLFNKELNIFEVKTKDDLINNYSLYTIKSIKYDKNFTKILDLRQKQKKGK